MIFHYAIPLIEKDILILLISLILTWIQIHLKFRSLHSRIRIWDSSNSLVEEYTRSCTILKRNEKTKKKNPDGPHYA